MRNTTAYYAMTQILDCNEVLEDLKSANAGDIPNNRLMKLTELVMNYRGLLVEEMQNTTLETYRIDAYQYGENNDN